MRSCPTCSNYERDVKIALYDPRPDGIPFSLFKCRTCGMLYVDSELASKEWFDNYYLNIYKTDDLPYAYDRLDDLADEIAGYEPFSVLDIGGMDRELQHKLHERSIPCDVSGVENDNQKKYDIVVLSHTFEHIYDISGMFKRILANLGNRLIVEVPIWYDYDDLTYDYHWQHINKFTDYTLQTMLINRDFHISSSESLLDYREYHCHRVTAWLE